MDCPHSLRGTRSFLETSPFYYPYGNTPARDFLEYISSSSANEEPLVLVVEIFDHVSTPSGRISTQL